MDIKRNIYRYFIYSLVKMMNCEYNKLNSLNKIL